MLSSRASPSSSPFGTRANTHAQQLDVKKGSRSVSKQREKRPSWLAPVAPVFFFFLPFLPLLLFTSTASWRRVGMALRPIFRPGIYNHRRLMDSGFAQFDVENAMKFVPIPAHLSLSVDSRGCPPFFPFFREGGKCFANRIVCFLKK